MSVKSEYNLGDYIFAINKRRYSFTTNKEKYIFAINTGNYIFNFIKISKGGYSY